MGPKFEETAYISEVNRAKKVKSDAQVATDPLEKLLISFTVARKDGAPNSNFPNFRNCLKRI